MKTKNKMMGIQIDPYALWFASSVCACGLIHYQFMYAGVVIEWGVVMTIDEMNLRYEALLDASMRPLC